MNASVLPAAAGVFERTISEVWGDRFATRAAEVQVIRTLWDPWTCPEGELPLLAWAWSVDIWNDGWPVHRKRLVVAEARAYHARKTTVAGFRMALSYVDAELVRAHLPRQGFVAGQALDPTRHAAWLAGLPEVRIHRVSLFSRPGRAGMFAGRRVARSARRIVLASRRAELLRGGVPTALAITGVGLDVDGRIRPMPEQLVMPTNGSNSRIHVGRGARRITAPRNAAGANILTLAFSGAVDADGFAIRATWASLSPIDVIPRWIAETHDGGRGVFAGGARRGRVARPNTADRHFYWSIRLADGSTVALGTMRNRVGRTRTRRERFTLGLLVHAPSAPRARTTLRSRLAHPDPSPRVAEIYAAADQARAARDGLFIDINSVRRLRYADLATMPATVTYGAYVRT